MATLSVDRRSGKIAGYNIQWHEGKKRRTIHLGGRRYNRKTAVRLKEIVEELLYYRRNGITVPNKTTEHWLQAAPACIRSKLAKAGLIAVTESKTCQRLWETFLQHKTGIKPKTVKAYNECRSHFFKPFSLTEPVEQITPERLQDWKASLLETHAVASVAGYIKNLGAVLRWAVKQKWLETNPLEGITRGSFVNREKDRIISMADYVKLLVACPNQEWRTIIALARIGGLRCPSELKSLRWSDVDWDKSRFVVKSPKTEQHDGKDKRVVPLFADLRSELKRQFDETKDSEFVIGSFQGTSWALSDAFQKIANAAGLGTIERPFDNLRTTRSNEVLERWGSAKESQWIGHSEAVMRKHYLLLPDEAFAEAADLDAENIHVKSHAKRT